MMILINLPYTIFLECNLLNRSLYKIVLRHFSVILQLLKKILFKKIKL